MNDTLDITKLNINVDALVDYEGSKYGEVQTWFPKLIYYKDNLHLDQLDDMATFVQQRLEKCKEKLSPTLNVTSGYELAIDQLETQEPFQDLCSTIVDHATWFGVQMGYTNYRFEIVHMWANISEKNDYLFPHVHANSLISGAFYLKAAATDKIVFFDSPSMLPNPPAPNPLTWNQVVYDCQPGRLILFKGDVLHGITRQQSEDEKIVVSFNLIGNPV